MAEVTVEEFANTIKKSLPELQEQLVDAGVGNKQPDDVISGEEKAQLLGFLQKKHNKLGLENRVSVRRKTTREIKTSVAVTGSSNRKKAKTKTVNIETKRRRTYVKKSDIAELQAEESISQQDAPSTTVAPEKVIAEPISPAVDANTSVMPEPLVSEEPVLKTETEQVPMPESEPEQVSVPEIEPEPVPGITVSTVESAADNVKADPLPEKNEGAEVSAKEVSKAPSKQDKKSSRDGHSRRKELHVNTNKSGRRRKKGRIKPAAQTISRHAFEKPTAPVVRDVPIQESIVVSDLAQRMSVKSSEVIKCLMALGSMVTINQSIDQDTAVVVVEEMGHKPRRVTDNEIEQNILPAHDADKESLPRSAVVTVMGHVDHGKTSLLDYIRNTRVTAGEAGGITQHIGAYQVTVREKQITFLDTPGHEAFTAMRARGAKVTDIAIIVVAADDGVMPQTEEAIKHAKAAGVPIIVAVNKIDKPDADVEKVRQALSVHDVLPEAWGGDTIFVDISAKTGQGVDELLENILLQAEVLELTAVVDCLANGVVIESKVDKGRGPVASMLVKNGTLKKGDILLSGNEYGRVRAMIDDSGHELQCACPAMPVEILGLTGAPHAGDEWIVVESEKKARELALFRQYKDREVKIARQQTSKLQNLMSQMEGGEQLSLKLLIKGDVHGSVEAITDALLRLSTDEVTLSVISSGVGGISASDVNLAIASDCIIIGFNVRADATARKLLDAEGISPRYYSVIYDVIDDIKLLAGGMLSPEIREQIIGTAEVRDIFASPKYGDIAGCIVLDGAIKRDNPIRVLRNHVVVYEGELESLRRFKDDVNEVKSGTECGVGVKNYDVKVGDHIEVFERIEVQRSL